MAVNLLRSKMRADPGIRPSATAFIIQVDHEGSILQAASYRPHDGEKRHVTSIEPYEHDFIRGFIADAFNRYTLVGAGAIEMRLPFEMIGEIFMDMDLQTLFAFHDTNNSARSLVMRKFEVRVILAIALDIVCVMLRTGAAPYITLRKLYEQLCKRECDFCNKRLGSLIHLMTCNRLCSTCMHDHAPKMVSMASAKDVLCLPNHILNTLPFMSTLTRAGGQPSTILVPLHKLLEAYQVYHNGALVPGFLEGQLDMSATYVSQSLTAAVTYNPHANAVENMVSCKGCRLRCVKTYYQDPYGGLEPRVEYEGITNAEKKQAIKAERTVYTETEFIEHFKVCGPAQQLWEEHLEMTAMTQMG